MEELDAFFDCIDSPCPHPATLKGNDGIDCLDEYFDCISETFADESMNDMPLVPPESSPPKKSPCQNKRGNITKKQHQRLSIEKIQQELESNMKCCAMLCLTLLTWQIVLHCRTQYVGLPTNTERWMFLEEEENKRAARCTQNKRESYCYQIPMGDSKFLECCASAWRFCYGISAWSHKTKPYLKKKNANISLKGGKSKHYNRRQRMAIKWLLEYSDIVGCKLPFSDHASTKPVVRLPFPYKSLVHLLYTSDLKGKGSCKPIDYPRFASVWKHAEELRHIKLQKYKPGFSQCDVCKEYKLKISKKLSAERRDLLNNKHLKHVQEFMTEKNQYYAARAKACSNSNKYMSVIMDAMDQRKTRIPWFTNPAKSIAHDFLLKLKLFCAIVHGFGYYYFWCTEQVKHDTNLAIEVLRRVLVKYAKEKGALPPILYLQVDNGPDQKSKLFLAFMAYLVEMNIFDKVKVSYLIVGHTHEDNDQAFSLIGKFFKKVLQMILSVSAFVSAIYNCFKTPACIPKCVEHIQCTFDLSILEQHLDKALSRFDLKEQSMDKVHYFVFKRNKHGHACMQYKLRRYSEAIYPRKYNVGSNYVSTVHGDGTIVECSPEKDGLSKEKYWAYTVRYDKTDEEGQPFETVFKSRASKCTITMFPDVGEGHPKLPISFPVNEYKGTFDDVLGEQRMGIDGIIKKLNLRTEYPGECSDWDTFWQSVPRTKEVPIELVEQFEMPPAQQRKAKKRRLPDNIMDDGVRPIDVVVHAGFRPSQRAKAFRRLEAEGLQTNSLDELRNGDILIIDFLPTNNDRYKLPFMVAEVDSDLTGIDTTNPDAEIPVQILRPTDMKTPTKKFIKWQGDDNQFWRPSIERGSVKFIVQLTAGKKISSKSIQEIKKAYKEAF
jgi:hypothetical protein